MSSETRFLGTGEAGYQPLRKIRTLVSGLRYAVLYDWSVTYKLIVSVVAVACGAHASADFLLILVVTTFVLVAEIFNSAIEALLDLALP